MIKILLDIELKNKQLYNYLVIPIIFICCFNAYTITKGYRANIDANKYNDNELIQAREKISLGEKVEKITLRKLKNAAYAGDQFYMLNDTLMKELICEYYDLPYETEIEYID